MTFGVYSEFNCKSKWCKGWFLLEHCWSLVPIVNDLSLSLHPAVSVVKGEGMPQYRNPFEKGDLFIKFDVQFPDNNWINPEKLVVSENPWGLIKHETHCICFTYLFSITYFMRHGVSLSLFPRNLKTCFLLVQRIQSSQQTPRRLNSLTTTERRVRAAAPGGRRTTIALMKRGATMAPACSVHTNRKDLYS